jgi:hypothetical protein
VALPFVVWEHHVANSAFLARGYHESTTVVTIGAWSFLKTMWALFWTAFLHPFTDTAIDLTTGEIIKGRDAAE